MIEYRELKKNIFGDILVAENINEALRKWRKIFNVTQSELAEKMGISSSVISEYENNPRRTPGTNFIKRFVNALIEIDVLRGGKIIRLISKSENFSPEDGILLIEDFHEPIPANEYIFATNSEVLVGEEYLGKSYIYGHTVIDGVTAILSLSGESFYRIYGRTTERALIFTNVSLGRSPLVAIRVYPLKPRLVILHGPSKIDTLGIKIAMKEKLILALSRKPNVKSLLESIKKMSKNFQKFLEL
mgnify:CR=1 FL=1